MGNTRARGVGKGRVLLIAGVHIGRLLLAREDVELVCRAWSVSRETLCVWEDGGLEERACDRGVIVSTTSWLSSNPVTSTSIIHHSTDTDTTYDIVWPPVNQQAFSD
jgi:hypothetical protein